MSLLERIVEVIRRTADPDQIILFGSRARGDERPESDYDICVLKSGVGNRRVLAMSLYRALLDTGAPVELVVETPDRFAVLRDDPFLIYRTIATEGRVVYARPLSG